MRFEIRAGGAFLILLGLLGLSCVVFALGLVAGYEMARQTAPETVQQAGVYPVPSPPAAEASPSAAQAMNPSATAGPTPGLASSGLAATKPASSENPAGPSAPPAVTAKGGSAVAAGTSSNRAEATASPAPLGGAKPSPAAHVVAKKPVAPPAEATAAGEAETPESGSRSGAEALGKKGSPSGAAASRGSAGPVKPAAAESHPRKPYNIQINAAMDRANADEMVSRLRKLGYHAFLVPTTINGQTWWQIRVGPYASREEAIQAEQRMHEQYRAAYAGH
jgi:DedD protein